MNTKVGGGWNTNLREAPKGEDVLVALRTLGGAGTLTNLGALLFEPYGHEEGETDDDIEGYWGENNGEVGVWHWHVGCDGYTDKDDILAWQSLPDAFVPCADALLTARKSGGG